MKFLIHLTVLEILGKLVVDMCFCLQTCISAVVMAVVIGLISLYNVLRSVGAHARNNLFPLSSTALFDFLFLFLFFCLVLFVFVLHCWFVFCSSNNFTRALNYAHPYGYKSAISFHSLQGRPVASVAKSWEL